MPRLHPARDRLGARGRPSAHGHSADNVLICGVADMASPIFAQPRVLEIIIAQESQGCSRSRTCTLPSTSRTFTLPPGLHHHSTNPCRKICVQVFYVRVQCSDAGRQQRKLKKTGGVHILLLPLQAFAVVVLTRMFIISQLQ
eukprot:SAG31_NODE_7380_length_1704_cov_1.867913_1_plen_141_part_10